MNQETLHRILAKCDPTGRFNIKAPEWRAFGPGDNPRLGDASVYEKPGFRSIEIHFSGSSPFETRIPRASGVNWSARGTRSAGETKAFAYELLQATAIVEEWNRLADMYDAQYREEYEAMEQAGVVEVEA